MIDPNVPLRTYVESLLAAHAEIHRVEHIAVALAREQVNNRLADLNRLREDVTTDRGQFVLKTNYDVRHDALAVRIDTVARDAEKERRIMGDAIDAHLKVLDEVRASLLPLLGLTTFIGVAVGSIVVYLIERGIHP